MDALYIGIDVSKDRLDVAANSPSIAPFHVPRDHGGLADLVERLKPLGIERIRPHHHAGVKPSVGLRDCTLAPRIDCLSEDWEDY